MFSLSNANKMFGIYFANLIPIDFKYNPRESIYYVSYTNGIRFIRFRILNDYDFNLDDVCGKLEIQSFIRFDNMHKWFYKFEHRKKSDLRFDWSYGKTFNQEIKVYIEGNNLRFDKDISLVLTFIKDFFTQYQSILDIKPIFFDDNKQNDNYNIRFILDKLFLSWVLKLDNYPIIEKNCIDEVASLYNKEEPMAMIYYPKLDDILNALKANSFDSQQLYEDFSLPTLRSF